MYFNVSEIRNEMELTLEQCEKSGIPRWNLVADPGIGFAKTGPQSIELLRNYKNFVPRPGILWNKLISSIRYKPGISLLFNMKNMFKGGLDFLGGS